MTNNSSSNTTTPEQRFELVPQEIDGVTMPNETFKPAVGDTYAVFGIMLPDAYICNNADKTGASWDMFREAARKLYENEDPKFTFTGTLQGLWAKKLAPRGRPSESRRICSVHR